MPPRPKLSEQTWFIRDNETDPSDKNSLLSGYLEGSWNQYHIVRIERIEIGNIGWLVTYRNRPPSRSRSRGTEGSRS